MATHQQSVGVDPERRAGHQRDLILAVFDLQQACVCGQLCVDAVHFVGQCVAQNVDIKDVTFFELINVRK